MDCRRRTVPGLPSRWRRCLFGRSHSILLSLLISFLLLAGPKAFGAKEEPFNVDRFFGWGGYYRPMEWTPLEIGITTLLKEPFAGAIDVAVSQDEQNTLHVRHPFVVTADLPLHLPLVTKIAYGASRCSLRLTDKNGRVQWKEDVDLWDFSSAVRPATSLGQNDMLIGLVGKRGFGVLKLPQEAACSFADLSEDQQGKVYIGDKVANMLPWDWTGFASLDLLILYDLDWDQLRPDQVRAITDWVAGGGRAVIVVGNLQLPQAVQKTFGLDVASPRQLTLPADLLAGWRLDSGQGASVLCSPVGLRSPGAAYRRDVVDANACVFAVLPIAFGRIGVLAFDPAGLGESQAKRATGFWVELICAVLEDPMTLPASRPSGPVMTQPPGRAVRRQWPGGENAGQVRTIRLASPEPPDAAAQQQPRGFYATGKAQMSATAVLEYLQDISQMRPLSIWPVLGLLVLLAVLIGPVDYFVLKRLDRQPWTWVTSTFWIVTFTIGAYYGVQALRGGNLQLRTVSVVDGIAVRGPGGVSPGARPALGWATTYSGLFVPRSDQYALEDLAANQWWSGISPVNAQIYQYGQRLGNREIFCLQRDGGNLPLPLPVSIWTMQYMMTEQILQEMPVAVTARVTGDQLRLEIANHSASAVSQTVAIMAGHRPLLFGTVASGATAEFTQKVDPRRISVRPDSAPLGIGLAEDCPTDLQTLFEAAGLSQRTAGIRSHLARGAVVVCMQMDQPAPGVRIKDRECQYRTVQWIRMLVWPTTSRNGETENRGIGDMGTR